MIRGVTTGPVPGRRLGLGSLTPSGRAVVPSGWALYDFANTIYSYAVVSYAMGLWLVEDTQFGKANGPFAFSVAIAVSVGINAIVSPILGALSDRAGGRRLPYLLFFTLLCIVPTALIGQSPAFVGLVLFTIANFAYQSALIYYDATLKTVSYPETRGKLSGIGVAIGYCGTIVIGVLIFLLDLPIASVFFVAAALYGLFAIPLFLVVREPAPPPGTPRAGPRASAIAALGQLRATILDARTVPGLTRFLVGRFFYSDAVNTIIVVMAIVATEAMGLTNTVANLILLALAIVAVLASFGWGWAVDRLGPKRTLMIVLSSWAIGLVVGGISLGVDGDRRARDVPAGRGDPRQRAWRRPGLRPRADAAALAAREARRVLRALRARGQGLAGHRAAAVRRDPAALPAGARRRRVPARGPEPARDDAASGRG